MRTWVAIASGPSLCEADIRAVQIARMQGLCKVAVTGRTWELAAWADLLYAADARWWNKYNPGDRFNGEKWTISSTVARRYGLSCAAASGIWGSRSPIVYTGGLSGIQLLNLLTYRSERIVLLGYDNQHTGGRRHWHHDYDQSAGFSNVPHLAETMKHWDHVAAECRVPIFNATRETALTQFPRVKLHEVLGL
jgi:hypothetical protein